MRSTSGERLRAAIQEAADAAAERNEPIWAVMLDEPLERVFCERGGQQVGFLRVMVADRYEYETRDTDRDGICAIAPLPPREHFAAAESLMPAFVGALRANGVHGTYRESGTERSYRF